MNKEAVSRELDEIKDIFRSKKLGRLFAGETNNTLIQFFRYIFVGGFATIVDWGLSALLFYAVFGETHPVAANSLSFAAGLIVNYLLSTFWIFKESRVKSKIAEFIGFALIGLVGLLITAGITLLFKQLLMETTSAYQIIAKITATAVSFLWNFFARKYLLFSKK